MLLTPAFHSFSHGWQLQARTVGGDTALALGGSRLGVGKNTDKRDDGVRIKKTRKTRIM